MTKALSFLAPMAIVLAACLASANAQPASDKIQSCESCHGKYGDSSRTDVPRINGQQRDYLLLRLRQFLDPTINTTHASNMMGPNASRLRDDEAVALADYFSKQGATSASPFGPDAEKGADIYRNGAGPNIASCVTCHGPEGHGLGSTPRLAGQHQQYLVNQLQAFMLTARVGDPMNHHAWDMTPDQMQAVTAYLSQN